MNWAEVSLLVNGVELGVLVWLLIHLRHSPAPYQAALTEQLRRDLDILRGTVTAWTRDYLTDKHQILEALSQIREEQRRTNARLDELRCPLGDPNCPLNRREG